MQRPHVTLWLALVLLAACSRDGHHGVHAQGQSSSSELSICLAFPVGSGTGRNALAAISACSRLNPILQSVYVNWTPSYCQFQAPSYVQSNLVTSGGRTVIYTCWDAPDENRFSAQLFRLWGATFPNVNPRFRDSLVNGLGPEQSQLSLFVRTPANAPRRNLRLPVGASAALGNWVLMQTDPSYAASPPPPFSGGVTLNTPPAPPAPPRGMLCGGAGDLLEVEGMQLCVSTIRVASVFDDTSCTMTLTYTIQNVGTNFFPVAGLTARLATTITNGTATYLPGSRDPFNVTVTPFNNNRDTAVSISAIGRDMPRGRDDNRIPIVLRFQITCRGAGTYSVNGMPSSCLCGAAATLTLLSGSSEVQCPRPFIQTRRGISRECFSPPQPTGLAVIVSAVNGRCIFRAQFAVNNRGGSAVQSIYGPLNVDLQWTMGMLQLANLNAENANLTAVSSNTSTFNIVDFGGALQPGGLGLFTLPLMYTGGQCAELADLVTVRSLLSVVQFSAASPPATTVQSVSAVVGVPSVTRISSLPFNDGDVVDSSSRCISPLSILMGYDASLSTSYLYVAYPYAMGNLPAFHGAFTRNIDATARFNAAPSPTATGDLTGRSIVTVRVYTTNMTGTSTPYVCGMDLWTVSAGTGMGQITIRPTYALGCSRYVVPGPTVPVASVDLNAPVGSFLGWFTGADSTNGNFQRRRVQSLQAVWVSCAPGSSFGTLG